MDRDGGGVVEEENEPFLPFPVSMSSVTLNGPLGLSLGCEVVAPHCDVIWSFKMCWLQIWASEALRCFLLSCVSFIAMTTCLLVLLEEETFKGRAKLPHLYQEKHP